MGAAMTRRTHARLSVRSDSQRQAVAELSGLIRAIETLFRTEQCVGPSTFRQDPLARVLVKSQLERVGERFGIWSTAE